MNFSYGIIAVVGILVAISLTLIVAEPNDIIEPRIIETPENKITEIGVIGITINKIAEIFLASELNFVAAFEANFLNSIPNNVGTTTIKNIVIAMLTNEISFDIFSTPSKPKDETTIKGIVITLSKLMIAVREIDKATSPFAKEVNMFDVTPPGAAALAAPAMSFKELHQKTVQPLVC